MSKKKKKVWFEHPVYIFIRKRSGGPWLWWAQTVSACPHLVPYAATTFLAKLHHHHAILKWALIWKACYWMCSRSPTMHFKLKSFLKNLSVNFLKLVWGFLMHQGMCCRFQLCFCGSREKGTWIERSGLNCFWLFLSFVLPSIDGWEAVFLQSLFNMWNECFLFVFNDLLLQSN